MKLISYSELAKLRMEFFWGANAKILETDLLSCRLGDGDGQQCRFSYFLWPPNHRSEVSEIALEAFPTEECPTDVAQAVIDRLGLPIKVSDSVKDVRTVLGTPFYQSAVPPDLKIVDFVVGREEKYYVNCTFNDNGLCALTFVRADRVKRWPRANFGEVPPEVAAIIARKNQ